MKALKMCQADALADGLITLSKKALTYDLSALNHDHDLLLGQGTQQLYNEPETRSEEPPSYTSVTHQTYSTLGPLEQQVNLI